MQLLKQAEAASHSHDSGGLIEAGNVEVSHRLLFCIFKRPAYTPTRTILPAFFQANLG